MRVAFVCLLLVVSGCREKPDTLSAPDGSASGRPMGGQGFSGTLHLGTTPELAPLVREQADDFMRLYPAATIQIIEETARGAVVGVLRGELEMAIVDRSMNNEEREIAGKYGVEVGQTLIGEGAVVVVVPEASPVQSLTVEDVRALIGGESVTWASVAPGAPGVARLVTTDRNAGTVEYVGRRLLPEGVLPQSAIRASDETDVLARVAGRSDAIGFVSALTYRRDTTYQVRAIPLVDSLGQTVQPSPRAVYLDEYPLRQPIVFVTRSERGGLGAGFATFLLDTRAQEVVQRAGLVPARPPVREFNLN